MARPITLKENNEIYKNNTVKVAVILMMIAISNFIDRVEENEIDIGELGEEIESVYEKLVELEEEYE